MPNNTRLVFKKNWLDMPVLLTDRTAITTDGSSDRSVHKKHIVGMTSNDANYHLKDIRETLQWDNLTFYDFRRTFVTKLKDRISDAQLKLLLGHRRATAGTAENNYLASHPPIDQAVFLRGSVVNQESARSSLAEKKSWTLVWPADTFSCPRY